ncbi:MAG TPA: hypothetical protein VIM63_19380 [Rhodoferax sp.]
MLIVIISLLAMVQLPENGALQHGAFALRGHFYFAKSGHYYFVVTDPVEATGLMSRQVGILEDSATHSNAAVASIGDQANYFRPNPLLRQIVKTAMCVSARKRNQAAPTMPL